MLQEAPIGIDSTRPSQQLLSPFSTRLLKQLKIPYGTDRGLQGVDVDPSLSVTQHIFECLALLKEVNRIYKAKGSLLSRSVGERVMLGFTNELANIVLDSISFSPPPDLSDANVYYTQVTNSILSLFPELASVSAPATGKVLLHHAAHKSSKVLCLESIKSIIAANPSGPMTTDKAGALPIHWATHNPELTHDALVILSQANPGGLSLPDNQGYLPLHWACNNNNPNLAVVSALLSLYPQAASTPCMQGSLPIHWACNRPNINKSLLELLIQTHPDGLRTYDSHGWLPLHLAVNHPNPNLDCIKFLIQIYPQALQCPNNFGHLPLHRALDIDEVNIPTVHLLLDFFSSATKSADEEGNLPIHIALESLYFGNKMEINSENLPNTSYSPVSVCQRLIEIYPECAYHKNKDGILPLHSLITSPTPSLEVAKLLLTIYPEAVECMAIDILPANMNETEINDPNFNVETLNNYDGEWMEKRWTPLSRAIDRNLDDFVELFRSFNQKNKSKSEHQLPTSPRPSTATANNGIPPIHNLSSLINKNDNNLLTKNRILPDITPTSALMSAPLPQPHGLLPQIRPYTNQGPMFGPLPTHSPPSRSSRHRSDRSERRREKRGSSRRRSRSSSRRREEEDYDYDRPRRSSRSGERYRDEYSRNRDNNYNDYENDRDNYHNSRGNYNENMNSRNPGNSRDYNERNYPKEEKFDYNIGEYNYRKDIPKEESYYAPTNDNETRNESESQIKDKDIGTNSHLKENSYQSSRADGNSYQTSHQQSRDNISYEQSKDTGSYQPSRDARSYEQSRDTRTYDQSRDSRTYDQSRDSRSYDQSRDNGSYEQSRGTRSYEPSRDTVSYEQSRDTVSYDQSRDNGSYQKSRDTGKESGRDTSVYSSRDNISYYSSNYDSYSSNTDQFTENVPDKDNRNPVRGYYSIQRPSTSEANSGTRTLTMPKLSSERPTTAMPRNIQKRI